MEDSLQLEADRKYVGEISAVRGSVVDIASREPVPPINTLFRAGENDGVFIEAALHLDEHTFWGIALTGTAALSRGDPAWSDGEPLKLPVGKSLLSRMFNVFGMPIGGIEPPKDITLPRFNETVDAAQKRLAPFMEWPHRQPEVLMSSVSFGAEPGVLSLGSGSLPAP